jgi:TolA-binding protein
LACTAFAVLSTAWAAGGAEPPAADGTAQPTQSTQSTELQQLKAQIEQQKKQIEELRVTLEAQQKLLEKAESVQKAENAAPAEPAHKAPNLGDVASTTPIIPRGVAPVPATALPSPAAQQSAASTPPTSPLQIHIGDATITPVGFLDLTNTYRSTNNGSGFATNFGNIPYNNTVGGRLTQDQFSAGNSRIGFRVDALFKDIHVLGYYEGDFVGTPAAFNTQVTSNSLLYRIRLYWVDLRKDKYELLAGQSWSMMTPNRNGLSALPGDLFYGQQFDVNYLNGLTWGRIPGIRFIYHPSNTVTWGISAENATQYFGGSGGAGVPTLPALLTGLTSNQIDANVANGQGLPTVFPDIISKLVIQPSSRVHVEFAGVLDHARVFNPNNPPALGAQQHFSTTGGGGSVNGNFEVVKNFRLITNNFWSNGAGRYLFGQAPNFIVRSNGSLSNIHSGSTLDGFEARIKNTQLYGYYGLIYISRNVALDANGTSFIGYGYPGSPNSQNKTTQEATIGITQTFFNDPKIGAVSMYLDYAYFLRNPWFIAPGNPRNAHQNAVWFDLRYTLPGSAPTIRY